MRRAKTHQVWCVSVWSWCLVNGKALAHWELLRSEEKKGGGGGFPNLEFALLYGVFDHVSGFCQLMSPRKLQFWRSTYKKYDCRFLQIKDLCQAVLTFNVNGRGTLQSEVKWGTAQTVTELELKMVSSILLTSYPQTYSSFVRLRQ